MKNQNDRLLYTFRTFPYQHELFKLSNQIFVFGKLKKCFDIFKKKIIKEKPKIIIGIARSTKHFSQFESITINQFNKTKKINMQGPFKYDLDIPIIKHNFEISKSASDSFCNWTMYKISNFLNQNKLKIKFSFVHIKKTDIQYL